MSITSPIAVRWECSSGLSMKLPWSHAHRLTNLQSDGGHLLSNGGDPSSVPPSSGLGGTSFATQGEGPSASSLGGPTAVEGVEMQALRQAEQAARQQLEARLQALESGMYVYIYIYMCVYIYIYVYRYIYISELAARQRLEARLQALESGIYIYVCI